MKEGQDISLHGDTILREELTTFLLRQGLPLPLAKLSAYLTRTINWEQAYILTLPIDAVSAQGVLESWLAHDDACRLIHSGCKDITFFIEGIIIVKRSVAKTSSPKVVATTILIADQSPQQSKLTIHNRVKVGYLSSRSIVTSALSACTTAAEMVLDMVSSPPVK